MNSLFQSFNSSPLSTKLSSSQSSNTEGPFFSDFGFYYFCNLSHHTAPHTCHLQPNWTSSFSWNSLRPIYACLHLWIWSLRSSTHANSFTSFSQSFQPAVIAMCLCLEQCLAEKYLFDERMILFYTFITFDTCSMAFLSSCTDVPISQFIQQEVIEHPWCAKVPFCRVNWTMVVYVWRCARAQCIHGHHFHGRVNVSIAYQPFPPTVRFQREQTTFYFSWLHSWSLAPGFAWHTVNAELNGYGFFSELMK